MTCQAQQGLERSHRRIPAVKAENKFIEIMLQVFGINAVVGTIEPSFQVPEGAMNMQCVGFGVMKFHDNNLPVQSLNNLSIHRY